MMVVKVKKYTRKMQESKRIKLLKELERIHFTERNYAYMW